MRKDLREIFLIYCGKSKKITKKMKMFTVKDLNLPKYEWLKNNKNSKMFTVKDLKLKKHKKYEWLKNNKNSKMFTVKDLKLKKHKKNENFIIF